MSRGNRQYPARAPGNAGILRHEKTRASLSVNLEVGPNPSMVRRPQGRVGRTRLVEAQAARDQVNCTGHPDVIDAPVHPRPVRMRNRTISVGERGEGCGRKLCRPEARRHQCSRRRIQAGIEIAANDRTRHIAAAVDQGQELLHLKQPQRVVAARHKQVSDIDVHRHIADENARDQRDHVARLVMRFPVSITGKRVSSASPSTLERLFTLVCCTKA